MPEAALPSLYAGWLRTVAGGPIPRETKATCDQCVMLPPSGSPPEIMYFHPVTKCCTFQPHLPNFLAGAILADPDPSIAEGRAAVEQRIWRRVAVTPSRAGAGALFGLLYGNITNVFGRAPALRCTYLNAAGGCGVWTHRPGVCATWYCKHVRGATGFRFWALADKLLRAVEQDLALWCPAELKVGSAEVVELARLSTPDVNELNGEIDEAQYRELWGEWAGREIEFYRACAGLVESLTWEQVCHVCGPRVRILEGLVRDAYVHLGSEAIPERLRLTRFSLASTGGGGYTVTTYSDFDPVRMSEALVRVLQYFDGRPTEEALEAIRKEQRIRVDLSLVRRLVDFGILKASELEQGALPLTFSR
jgi:hypothetical protein